MPIFDLTFITHGLNFPPLQCQIVSRHHNNHRNYYHNNIKQLTMSDSNFGHPSIPSHQLLPPPVLQANPLTTPIKMLSQTVATMKALAEELDKEENGAQYRNLTAGAKTAAAKFSGLEEKYEEAKRRRDEDDDSEFRERLIHNRINHMEADSAVLGAILNDPGRAEELRAARANYKPLRTEELEEENEHMRDRIKEYQGEVAKLRRMSEDWKMWCLWESMHTAGPHVLKCTENLLAITVMLARQKWGVFIGSQGKNVTPDIQNIERYVEMAYKNREDAARDDGSDEKE